MFQFWKEIKKNLEWAAVHADILVLYKVRHQRFLKFTWYTVYTYKTTKFFKCIKGSLSECIQQILKLWSCWFSGLSTGHLLQQRDLLRKDKLFNLPLKLWDSETNLHEFYRTKLECLQDLHSFLSFLSFLHSLVLKFSQKVSPGWFRLLLGSDCRHKAKIHHRIHLLIIDYMFGKSCEIGLKYTNFPCKCMSCVLWQKHIVCVNMIEMYGMFT